MKIVRFIFLLFVISVVSNSAQAKRYSNNFKKGASISDTQKLKISNKFGNIQISNSVSDSIIVDVDIWVEENSERNAERILDLIEIHFSKSNGTLSASTLIDLKKGSNIKFGIDYLVYIPADKALDITSKFGDVTLDSLSAKGEFSIQYGNFAANKLMFPEGEESNINLAYATGTFGEMSTANVKLDFSKFYGDSAKQVSLKSNFSDFHVNRVTGLDFKAEGGSFRIDTIGNVNGKGEYTNFDIEKLTGHLVVNTLHGNLNVVDVSESFSRIEVENQFGKINLGLKGMSKYYLDVDAKYSEVNHPSSKGLTAEIDDNKLVVFGFIGEEQSSISRRVKLQTKYGNIQFN